MVERVVYVLGAGASFDAGGPLIKDFFSDGSERSAKVHSEYFDGDEKYSALKAVYDDWAKITQNPNVEGFFKKVEFYDTINKDFEDPRKGELMKPGTLKRWLEWYIAAYVRNSVARQRNPPQYYQQFAGSLKGWGMRYSVITFNYDLVLERAIIGERRSVDYKLGQIEKTYSSGIPFLKLHGSLNWVYCPDCGRWEIYEEPVGPLEERLQPEAAETIPYDALARGELATDISLLEQVCRPLGQALGRFEALIVFLDFPSVVPGRHTAVDAPF